VAAVDALTRPELDGSAQSNGRLVRAFAGVQTSRHRSRPTGKPRGQPNGDRVIHRRPTRSLTYRGWQGSLMRQARDRCRGGHHVARTSHGRTLQFQRLTRMRACCGLARCRREAGNRVLRGKAEAVADIHEICIACPARCTDAGAAAVDHRRAMPPALREQRQGDDRGVEFGSWALLTFTVGRK